MLSFAPPFHVVGGYPVFADHADPGLFHILPAVPRLATGADGLPALSLSRYLGDGAQDAVLAGGFLNLTATLSVPVAARAMVRTELSARLGRPVRLVDALFDEGRVDLMLLGTSGSDGGTGPFDVTILGSGMPSMAGANTAAFQVTLDARAAALLDQAIGLPGLPAMVVYRHVLTGLHPAYSLRVTADWSRFHRELTERLKGSVWVLRADLETAVTEARQAAGVKVESTVMDGAATGDAAAAERHLLDWITGTFFAPAHGTAPAPASPLDGLADTVTALIDGLMPGVAWTLKSLHSEDLRRMEARIDQTLARRRDVVFQETIGGALTALRLDETGAERAEWPAMRARMVTGVNIAAIPRREVTLGVTDRFASDGLAAVEIEIGLADPVTGAPDAPRGFIFHDAAARQVFALNLLGAPASRLTDPYLYRLRVHFDPAGPFGAQPAATGPWTAARAGLLVADPRVDGPYRLRSPRIGVAPGFPFAQFPTVQVETLRREPDGREDQHALHLLTPQTPEVRWTFRGHGADAETFRMRVTYDRPAAAGGPVMRDWEDRTALLVTLPDPLPHHRRATFFLNLPWPEIAVAFLELRYDDPANGLRIDDRIDLSRDTAFVERVYAVADPAVQRLGYRVTAFLPARGLVQGDWHETDATTFVIGREIFDLRLIRFRAVGLPPAARGLADLVLIARMEAPDGTVLHDTRIEVAPDATAPALRDWTFPRAGTEGARLRVRADWRDPQGFPGGTGWQDAGRDLVLFNLAVPGFSAPA